MKYLEQAQNWWDVPHDNPGNDRRYHKPGWFRRLVYFLTPGRVSRVHLYEAQEHYLLLLRILEYHKKTAPNGECFTPEEKKKLMERNVVIEQASTILDDAKWLLTRRQNDLNFLWRDLCRVYIMLLEHVLPDRLLPTQLDFCREQAQRLGAAEDPVVKEMLQRLAEATPEEEELLAQNKARMVRAIRALVERFTSIRTDRIHQQFVNICTYQRALVVLLTISVVMIANVDIIVRPPALSSSASPVAPQNLLEGNTPNPVQVADSVQMVQSRPAPPKLGCQAGILDCVARSPVYLLDWLQYHLKYNILLFVFFAGLAGGFFSVVIRLRDRDLVPGEDAYFLWYVLSKPFVGALGAMILFILLQASFVDLNIAQGLTQDLMGQPKPGAAPFGFSFLAGFSERIVFPHFR